MYMICLHAVEKPFILSQSDCVSKALDALENFVGEYGYV